MEDLQKVCDLLTDTLRETRNLRELKKQNKEENLYDVEIIDEFFKDCDEDEKVLIAAQGWAEEKNGFTILFEETT